MKPFKFLKENDEDNEPIELYECASWVYGSVENIDQYEYDIVVENHRGIRTFLDHFPVGFVVVVISITGPNGIRHDINNNNQGWGFDILNDMISVEWVRFNYQ
jgi:hypothetical protein